MDKYEYLWMLVRNNNLPGDISHGEYIYEEIMKMNENDLTVKLCLSEKQAGYIMSTKERYDIDYEFDKYLQSEVKSVTIREDEYPIRLRYIENSPYALFYYGELPKDNIKAVAVIGSRECSEYGRIMAERLSAGLATKKVEIISGMAYGIDGVSQMSALNSKGKSYAVLGGGVDLCYPRVNRVLYERLKSEGGIISEYPPNSPAKAENFPFRNRIISGLSDIVIVVEAKMKSGTLITVDYALSQGREIMVVPGRATDVLSVGCNALLFQGAYPVQDSEDVIRILDTIPSNRFMDKTRKSDFKTTRLKEYIPKPSEKILLEREENMVYSVLDFYALSPEKISESVNLDIFQIMNILVSLELKGLIKETGKNLYVKCNF